MGWRATQLCWCYTSWDHGPGKWHNKSDRYHVRDTKWLTRTSLYWCLLMCFSIIIAICAYSENKNKLRRRRKVWVKPCLLSRKVKEACFRIYWMMVRMTFVENDIAKQDTRMGRSTSPRERLWLTVHNVEIFCYRYIMFNMNLSTVTLMLQWWWPYYLIVYLKLLNYESLFTTAALVLIHESLTMHHVMGVADLVANSCHWFDGINHGSRTECARTFSP